MGRTWFARRSTGTAAHRRRHADTPAKTNPFLQRLRLEPLEDRRMLSVFAVNSMADAVAPDGVITLREALEAANTNAAFFDAPAGSETETDVIIIFAQDPVDPAASRITLDGQQLTILDDVEIYGRARTCWQSTPTGVAAWCTSARVSRRRSGA